MEKLGVVLGGGWCRQLAGRRHFPSSSSSSSALLSFLFSLLLLLLPERRLLIKIVCSQHQLKCSFAGENVFPSGQNGPPQVNRVTGKAERKSVKRFVKMVAMPSTHWHLFGYIN